MLIEDNPLYVRLIQEMLDLARQTRFDMEEAYRLSTGLARLTKGDIDVVLLDLSLPDSQGYQTFARVHQQMPQVPVVVLTNLDNETLAVKTVYAGAQDYLLKADMNSHLLVRVIRYAIERQRMMLELVGRHTRRWQSSETRFRTVIDNAADGILIVDRHGIVRFANQAAEAMFQHKMMDLVAAPFGFPIVTGETTELDLIGSNGEVITVEMRVTETDWDGDQVYLASLRDITERRQAEEERQTHAQQQMTVAQLGQHALAEVNLDALLNRAVHMVAETCKVEYCQILELLPDRQKLRPRAGFGWPDGYIGGEATVPANSASLAGYTLTAKEPVYAASLATETRFTDPLIKAYGLASSMSTVIHGQGQPFGVISAQTVKNRKFSPADLNFLQAVANVLATAIERLNTEEQLRASLREKEVLLREIHHRVKNNLQAISNLLYLQSNYVQDPQVLQMFRETQDRVKSIALIHERLYETRDLAQIDFAEYIRSLAEHLIYSYHIESGAVQLEVDIDDVRMDVDTAIPLGVIINELVANCLKHAFGEKPAAGQAPLIRIEMRASGNRPQVLTVRDNGAGFPEGLDISQTSSLGLQLVHMLSTHIAATTEIENNHGTTVRIRFTRSAEEQVLVEDPLDLRNF